MAIVILPLEVYAREIDHKLLLAGFIAKETGLDVLVANSHYANKVAELMGNDCIYVGKNVFISGNNAKTSIDDQINNDLLIKLLYAGCKVIFNDEEGGLQFNCDYSSTDESLLRMRIPIRTSQALPNKENFSICHWGLYQTEIASSLFPDIRHIATGYPHTDAAKLYRNTRTFFDPESPIGITSNSTFLGDWANQNRPLYLSLNDYARDFGESEVCRYIMNEVALASLSAQLKQKSCNVVYRPHPGSYGFAIEEWLRYCNQFRINVSLPSRQSALSYLSSLSLNIHTSCSTSITSFLLRQPTICFRPKQDTAIGRADNLVKEANANTLEELIKHIDNPILPTITNKCLLQLHGIESNELESFMLITNEVLRFRSNVLNAKALTWRIKAYLEYLCAKQSIKKISSGGLSGYAITTKYRRFYRNDIARNFDILHRAWPANQFVARHITNHSVLLSAI